MFRFLRESGLVQIILLAAIGVIIYLNWPKILEEMTKILENIPIRFNF